MVPGAVGNCICPVCNTNVQHQRGIPCYQTICPNCGAQMTRQFIAPASVSSQLGTDSTQIPRIDPDICNGCGVCISTCPRGAIELVNEKAIIHPESCSNCRACIAACPVSAIN